MKLLFVCTGNICRSPFAEAYLRKRAGESGLTLAAESAGTYALEGNRATIEAVAVAAEFGVDLRPHRASPVEARRIERFDLLLAMSRSHEEELLDLRGIDREKPIVYLLGQFHPKRPDPPDIPDPIGGSVEHYRSCYQMIAEACDSFLDLLREGRIRT